MTGREQLRDLVRHEAAHGHAGILCGASGALILPRHEGHIRTMRAISLFDDCKPTREQEIMITAAGFLWSFGIDTSSDAEKLHRLDATEQEIEEALAHLRAAVLPELLRYSDSEIDIMLLQLETVGAVAIEPPPKRLH